jgi:hypothetical protein
MGQGLHQQLLVPEGVVELLLNVAELARQDVVALLGSVVNDFEGGLAEHSEGVEEGLTVVEVLVL